MGRPNYPIKQSQSETWRLQNYWGYAWHQLNLQFEARTYEQFELLKEVCLLLL